MGAGPDVEILSLKLTLGQRKPLTRFSPADENRSAGPGVRSDFERSSSTVRGFQEFFRQLRRSLPILSLIWCSRLRLRGVPLVGFRLN